jgi:hypothetical protein
MPKNVGAEHAAQIVQRLIQRPTGVRLVRVGPEEGEQLVAPDEPRAGAECQIYDQRRPFGLCQESRPGLFGKHRLERPEHPQFRHRTGSLRDQA